MVVVVVSSASEEDEVGSVRAGGGGGGIMDEVVVGEMVRVVELVRSGVSLLVVGEGLMRGRVVWLA